MTFTKEWLQKAISDIETMRDEIPFGLDEDERNTLAALKLALASLEAEPVGEVVLGEYDDCGCHPDARVVCTAADGQAEWENFKDGTRLYTAAPAPVVPDIGEIRVGRLPTMNQDDYPGLGDWWVQLRIGEDSDEVLVRVYGATPQEANSRAEALACRAAMLQGAEPVSQHPELTVWYGSMPETNGKANWTAILHRKGKGIQDGMTIDRSEYPGRVLYAADRVRYLIGEKADRPCILDYDADAHSGYVKPGNSPVISDGWKLVPVEPTAEMISSGIAAHYERSQIQIHDRTAPGPMECAYVAMLAAAAPQQEVK